MRVVHSIVSFFIFIIFFNFINILIRSPIETKIESGKNLSIAHTQIQEKKTNIAISNQVSLAVCLDGNSLESLKKEKSAKKVYFASKSNLLEHLHFGASKIHDRSCQFRSTTIFFFKWVHRITTIYLFIISLLFRELSKSVKERQKKREKSKQ